MSLSVLRILGAGLALSLMIGELIRSWGAGRPIMFVLDDFFMGGLLLIGAILMAKPTRIRWGVFVAGWASCAGMMYGSFFGKVFDPASANSGNLDLGLLTALIGVGFAVSLVGLGFTLVWKPAEG
ncbi:MAG: hypothetical protein AAGK01_07320 [Pseudomonadota bacterium]